MSEPTGTQEALSLWTLEEIGRVVSESGNPEETLLNVVHLIQRRFDTDVCSLYMLDFERANLVLSATIGLQSASVGKVSMRLDEGLVGLVAETGQPQFVADATTHPRFKFFPDAGEDRYHSFLGVPVIARGLLQGVLVIQTADPRMFGPQDVRMLAAAAELENQGSLRRSPNPRVPVEMLLLRLSYLDRTVSFEELIGALGGSGAPGSPAGSGHGAAPAGGAVLPSTTAPRRAACSTV